MFSAPAERMFTSWIVCKQSMTRGIITMPYVTHCWPVICNSKWFLSGFTTHLIYVVRNYELDIIHRNNKNIYFLISYFSCAGNCICIITISFYLFFLSFGCLEVILFVMPQCLKNNEGFKLCCNIFSHSPSWSCCQYPFKHLLGE